MEHEGPLPDSQGPYPESDQFTTHHPTLSLQDPS
jgi:hypothetical protein